MRIVKKIIIIVVLLFVFVTIPMLVDYNRFINKNENPLFTFKKELNNDKTIYRGLLYSLVQYHEIDEENEKIKYRSFNTIIYKRMSYTNVNSISTKDFTIEDNCDNCEMVMEYFYQDDKYIYYFDCAKSNNVFIIFENGYRVPIKEALKQNLVTIEKVEEKKLKFTKKEYDNLINMISYNELENLINDKKSFILLVIQDGCSHCISFIPKFNKVLYYYNLSSKAIDIRKLSDDNRKKFNNLFKITGTPTVIFIDNGIEKSISDRIIGNKSEDSITNTLKENGYVK